MTTAVETIRDVPFTIGGRSFHSRLMVGTGKYRDNGTMAQAIEASGAEIVTVAVRRVDLDRTKEEGVLYHLDPKRYFLLANTAGGYTAEDAVRYARLAREAGVNEFIKLEGIGGQETLLPDVQGLLAAARDPVAMARAMRLAVEAGRTAYLAGRMAKREVAVPSSPLEGMLD